MFKRISWICCTVCCLGMTLAPDVDAEPPPDYSLTAKAYHDELKADPQAARRKYVGKTIELEGVLSSMSVYSDQVAYITLQGQVGCYVDDPQPWERFGDGQKVRVRGTFTPRLVGIGLEHCTLTAISESPLIKQTAYHLAKEFKQDLEAAKDKYNNRQFLIIGTIAKIDRDEQGPVRVYLHGVEGVSVSCGFSYDLEPRLRSLKVGQEFKCCGTFLRVLGTKDDVGLVVCLPIKPPAPKTSPKE